MKLKFKTFSGRRMKQGAGIALKHKLCFPNGELILYFASLAEGDFPWYYKDGGKIILAIQDEKPVGSCYVHCGELQLYVTPKLRRQHIGTALYRKAQAIFGREFFSTKGGGKASTSFFEAVK